nr:J431 [uncultured bacterium]
MAGDPSGPVGKPSPAVEAQARHFGDAHRRLASAREQDRERKERRRFRWVEAGSKRHTAVPPLTGST